MSLTSLPVVAAGWVIAIAVFVGTVGLLGRRFRWAMVVQTVATLMTCVSVLCALGLTINRPMAYFSTTDDLLRLIGPAKGNTWTPAQVGTPPAKPLPKKPGPLTKIPAATDPEPEDSSQAQLWKPTWQDLAGGVRSTTWTGPESGATEPIQVWTPRGYSPRDKRTYSVAMFLHGYPGSMNGVFDKLAVQRQLQQLIDRKVIPPTIFVVPEVNLSSGAPSCADIPGKAQAQKWLSRDVPKMIRTVFPNVGTLRSQWFVLGISAGAYCAGRTALIHPEVWGSAGILSGYDFPELGALGQGSVELGRQNTLSVMMGSPRAFPAWLYISGTQSDPDSVIVARKIVTGPLRSDDRVFSHIAPKGGHNWLQWRHEFPYAFTWWGKQVKGALAHASPAEKQVSGDVTSHKVPRTHTASAFSLQGWGTLVLSAVISLFCLVLCVAIAPRAGRHRHQGPSLGARVGALTVCVLAVLVTAGLVINRLGEFYASFGELLTEIGLG